MIIYRLRLDSNRYRSLLPVDSAVWDSERLTFDGTPKGARWESPEVYVHNPRKEEGDFYHLASGTFAVRPEALAYVRNFMETAGELLPLQVDGCAFGLLNILECANCLDDSHSEWIYGSTTGEKIRIARYSFSPTRMTESTIFKIPQTCRAEILVTEGMKDPEDEFKYVVEKSKLRGLLFEKLWDSNVEA